MTIFAAVLIFSFIVIIHELGHFLAAKKAGIEVVEFSLGMGPRLLSYRGRQTRYSLKLLPIGGSCMMKGEDNEESEEGSFNSKSVWARLSVIVAGPLFNFILAFVMALILTANVGVDFPVVGTISEGYPAYEAGIQEGDRILSINKRTIHVFRDISMYLQMNPGKELVIELERPREGERNRRTVTLTPMFSEETGGYRIGIVSRGESEKNLSLPEWISYSTYEVAFQVKAVVYGLLSLVRGQVGARDVGGPVAILGMIGSSVGEASGYGLHVVFLTVISMIILFSSNLGVMNLLLIPALDGGRIALLLLEAITGHPLNRKIEGMIHFAGFALLMLLMAFVVVNDVRNLFFPG